jgi:hypothetical protein
MGLDIYVGSLTRYYAGDWETVIQKYARETGTPLQVVRPNQTEEEIADKETIRADVIQWRSGLSEGLKGHLSQPLDWDESDSSPYFTDKPAWDGYSSLLLWAAYLEHPELTKPKRALDDWTGNEAFRRSTEENFKTAFPTLLLNTEIWLPVDFTFTFAADDVGGNTVRFGSAVSLRRELDEINLRTWNADAATLATWRDEGAERDTPLEVCARFGFSIMRDLAASAVEHKLVMKLDY